MTAGRDEDSSTVVVGGKAFEEACRGAVVAHRPPSAYEALRDVLEAVKPLDEATRKRVLRAALALVE